MSIEKRIQDHMSEQAARIEIDSTDPAVLAARPPERPFRAVGVLAAAVVVLLAGAGFWMLSSEDPQVTEIAAGESEDSEDDGETGDAQDSSSDTASPITFQRTDVSSDSSPGYGQVEVHEGVYYVLSTAPGKVDLSQQPDDEAAWAELYRPRTFYILGQDNQWKISDVGDRFVSDYTVDDGVMYVISTGTTNGDGAAFGTSNDQGGNWDWTPLDNLPVASQMKLLFTDEAKVIYAARWGGPDWQQAIQMANDAGLEVDQLTVQDVNGEGITYIPIDPSDRCRVLASQYIPELQDFDRYIEEETVENQDEAVRDDLEDMTTYFKQDFEEQGCEWNEAWESGSGDSIEIIELPDPVTVPWADIGVTVPETWKSWASVYTLDDGQLTEHGKPFGDDVQPGDAQTKDGELIISTYGPFNGDEEPEGEDLWITRDGVNWRQDVRRWDQEDNATYYYDDISYMEPRAGQYSFQMWWDDSRYVEMEEAAMEAEQQLAAGEITDEEASDLMTLIEPTPELQRKNGSGPWETISLAELAPGVDVGDRVIQDIRGTSLGVFLVFGNSHGTNGPSEAGITVVHSNNGVDWSSFELDGHSAETYSDGDQVLVFSNSWLITEEGGTFKTQTVLISAGD